MHINLYKGKNKNHWKMSTCKVDILSLHIGLQFWPCYICAKSQLVRALKMYEVPLVVRHEVAALIMIHISTRVVMVDFIFNLCVHIHHKSQQYAQCRKTFPFFSFLFSMSRIWRMGAERNKWQDWNCNRLKCTGLNIKYDE